jgi:UDPglucose 6-dehydrogenase
MKKICVLGLWHLGSVTAAHLAKLKFQVVGYDRDSKTIEALNQGRAPIREPGLDVLLAEGLKSNHLRFTSNLADAAANCSMFWVTFDTPVDDQDRADIASIEKSVQTLLRTVSAHASIILSSQVPVGFCRRQEAFLQRVRPKDNIVICYSPENLRLGKALDVIANPDRIIVGVCHPDHRSRFEPVFAELSNSVQWMRVESAEMVKHALNAFLATSVVFANEIASVCEAVGANAREVAQGLLSESRIGPKAYLHPGAAFAGGTLARDVQFLIQEGKRRNIPLPMITGIQTSNRHHQEWVKQKIKTGLKRLKGKSVTLLGLTYKTGTDTLRRSWAIELAQWLQQQGARVQAYDPLITSLPTHLKNKIHLASGPQEALAQADCAVVVNSHEVFRGLLPSDLTAMRRPFLIDPNGILFTQMTPSHHKIDYMSVGYLSHGHDRS